MQCQNEIRPEHELNLGYYASCWGGLQTTTAPPTTFLGITCHGAEHALKLNVVCRLNSYLEWRDHNWLYTSTLPFNDRAVQGNDRLKATLKFIKVFVKFSNIVLVFIITSLISSWLSHVDESRSYIRTFWNFSLNFVF